MGGFPDVEDRSMAGRSRVDRTPANPTDVDMTGELARGLWLGGHYG